MNSLGVLYICTGEYYAFWENFYLSARKRIKGVSKVKFYVFTDSEELLSASHEDVVFIRHAHQNWPMPTLLRFKTFDSFSHLFDVDYLIFCNANLSFVEDVNIDFLFNFKDMFATLHPGYVNKNNSAYPLETNKKSTSYFSSPRLHYVCGGFYGGKCDLFLKMCRLLSLNIDTDLKLGIVAKWHDETHFNKFYHENNYSFNLLDSSFCHPQSWPAAKRPKIIVLDKDRVISMRHKGFIYMVKTGMSRFLKLVFRRSN